MTIDNSKDKGHDFKLERLKFILQQIDRLNERFHKNVALFQTLATAIIGAGAAVVVGWSKAGISADAARTVVQGLVGLLVILCLFVVASVFTGVFSWFDYRREEVRLLDEVVSRGYRQPPKASAFWRWHETYLILFVVLSTIVIVAFSESHVLPLIQETPVQAP